jgi:hypothetical protein
MKYHFISLLVLLAIHYNGIAQVFYLDWQQCLGGTDSEWLKDIIVVNNGYLMVGTTRSNDGDVSFNHGNDDAWVVRTNNHGELIWEKSYGGSMGDGFSRIFPTPDNCYYLLGGSYSSDGDISNDPYPESMDYWIVKIDSLGNILWERILGGNWLDQMWTGTLTDDGGVVAFGWTGSPDGDVSNWYGGYDMWMVKLSGEGEKEWDFSLGTSGMETGLTIIQTSDGGFLVGGTSNPGNGGNIKCEPMGVRSDAMLVKLDKDRNIEWQQCYGGSNSEGITALFALEDGYLFSAFANSADGDLTGSGWHGDSDIWIVKTDFNGEIIWQKCYGGSKFEEAANIFQLSDGGFVVSGYTFSQDGDVLGNHSIGTYFSDIWIFKISTTGILEWQQCIGGHAREEMAYGIIKKSDYNFVIAGQSNHGPSYDVTCTTHFNGTTRRPDFWLFELKDTTVNVTENNEAAFGMKVYPNPSGTGEILLEMENTGLHTNMQLKVFDVYGKQIHSEKVYPDQGATRLDVSLWLKGMYVVLVYSEGAVKGKCKVVVK